MELRRQHPGWGPRTILSRLARAEVSPLPSRSGIYRALVRHQLIEPKRQRRRASEYKRWERARAMELWQMDITLGVRLRDGSRLGIVTGIDDHSRYCVSAKVVERATAGPVCDALLEAMRRHGVPEAILTGNGKVFTGRFGPRKGEVMFDPICREQGIRHLLTAPASPPTTGKVERFHKTMKREFLDDRVFGSVAEAQEALDGWVRDYNGSREHQSLGNRPEHAVRHGASPSPRRARAGIVGRHDGSSCHTTGASASAARARGRQGEPAEFQVPGGTLPRGAEGGGGQSRRTGRGVP